MSLLQQLSLSLRYLVSLHTALWYRAIVSLPYRFLPSPHLPERRLHFFNFNKSRLKDPRDPAGADSPREDPRRERIEPETTRDNTPKLQQKKPSQLTKQPGN